MKHVHAIAAAAAPAASEFPALPEGLQRETLLELVRATRTRLGLSRGALDCFIQMARLTRPRDWIEGVTEPCCYMAQTELAHLRQVSVARQRAHERELGKAGLIDLRTAANGARSGFLGCGVFFGPAIRAAEALAAIRDAAEAERREAARLRGLRSIHKRHLKSALSVLMETAPGDDRVAEIAAGFHAWPAAAALHRMSLDALAVHEAEAADLCGQALALEQNLSETAPRPLETERPFLQETTQDPKDVSCKGQENDDDANRYAPPVEMVDGAAKRGSERGEDRIHDHRSVFLDRLTPARLYHLASCEMRLHLDSRRKDRPIARLHAHDFTVAAVNRLPELGIDPSAWTTAVRAMGEAAATICVLIADANRTAPLPVRNPGGYLRGMTAAHRKGQLNLTGGLIGLAERRRWEGLD